MVKDPDTKTVTDAMRSVVGALLESESKRVTKYLSPTFTIKATRVNEVDRRYKRETFVVSVGRPNFAEREFIKAATAAGEPFPVHRIQHKAFPRAAA